MHGRVVAFKHYASFTCPPRNSFSPTLYGYEEWVDAYLEAYRKMLGKLGPSGPTDVSFRQSVVRDGTEVHYVVVEEYGEVAE